MSDLAYFRRRLAHTQQASALPPQSRFNLAASTVDDDALEETVAQFGGPPAGESGFGTADILNEMLSKDPRFLPVTDLKQHQQSLIDMGYAQGDATGEWSPYWYAADRRADRDALDVVKSGGNFLATPTKKFFEYLTYTLPSAAFDGIYGIATGIVEDFMKTVTSPKQVAEEGGLLGGAAVGAGTGAIIGSIVPGFGTAAGAVIGGAVGGAAGFFADLFDGNEEEEEGNWARIWEAASPFDEIGRGDAKHLFAALSTVMSASGVLKAGSLAVKGGIGARGVAQTLATPSLAPAVAGQTIRQAGLRSAFQMAGKGTVAPGIASQVTQAAIKRPIVAGAAVGSIVDAAPELLKGEFGAAASQAVRGAVVGGLAGRGVKALPEPVRIAALKGLQSAPLRRIEMSGAGQVARSIYTPISVAGISGHLAGELEGTGVQKGIERAPDLGVAGDVMDWTVGLVTYPERLFPWRARELSRAMQAMGSENMIAPFAQAARRVRNPDGSFTTLSTKEAGNRAREILGATDDGYDAAVAGANAAGVQLQYGLERVAKRRVGDRVRAGELEIRDDPAGVFFGAEVAKERSNIVARMFEEAGGADPSDLASFTARSDTAKEIVQEAVDNPAGLINYIDSLEGRGSGLEHLMEHRKAEAVLMKASRRVRVGEGGATKAEDFIFTPALRDDPTNGVTGYQTRQMVEQVTEEYVNASTAYKQAVKATEKAKMQPLLESDPLAIARTEAGMRLDNIVQDMHRRKLIADWELDKLRPTSGRAEVDETIVERLQEVAKVQRPEITELSDELATQGLNRYVAISTGENMVFHDHIPYLLAVSGIGAYRWNQRFFDLLSSVGTRSDRADIGEMRFNSIVGSLEEVAVRHPELGLDGKGMAKQIYRELKTRYDPEAALLKGEQLTTMGPLVRRQNLKTMETKSELFKIDVRDLRPEDISEALNLGALGDIDDPLALAGEIKRALHEGASFGATITKAAAHPVNTARALGRSMRVNGLTGFNDFMRTTNVVPTKLAKRLPERFQKGSYGYLPHNIRRAHMAVQFSMSPFFDMSRYVEAISFGAMKGSIPARFATSPIKSVREAAEWRSPYSAAPVQGEEALDHMRRFADEVFHGRRPLMQNFDELQMRMQHRGILGFKPKEIESAHAWFLAQKKLAKGPLKNADMEEIRHTVQTIHHYGSKQSPFGNSMHFAFFPYLFTKKQLEVVHDFVLGAPMRNLLVHEGFRRWYQLDEGGTSMSDRFNDTMEKHLPIAKELARLNNFAYGVGPGRFFLEGFMDHSTQGKVGQGLASFFLPGGVHQPVHEATGKAIDIAYRQFFTPQVWFQYGKRLTPQQEMLDLVEGLVPAYRDLNRWWFDEEQNLLGQTITAAGEGMTAGMQYQEFSEAKRTLSAELEAVAEQMGFASWESLRSSNVGAPIRDAVNEIDMELGSMFPSGAAIADRFTNMDKVKDRVLYDIVNKDERTEAEEAILAFGTVERDAMDGAAQLPNMTQAEMTRIISPILRSFAANYLEDRQFMGLYDALFKYDYGTLRRIAA